MPKVFIKRGTRAQLNAAAGASGLNAGELYLITDESRLAVGTSVSAFQTIAGTPSGGTSGQVLAKSSATDYAYTWTTPTVTWANVTSLPAAIDAINGLTPAADRLAYYTGATTASLATLTTFGRNLIDDADAATARSTLGLGTAAVQPDTRLLPAGGSSGQVLAKTSASDYAVGWTTPSAGAYSSLSGIPAAIDAIDGLTPAADRIAYYTGASTASLAVLTSTGRDILLQTSAANVRTYIGAQPAGSYVTTATGVTNVRWTSGGSKNPCTTNAWNTASSGCALHEIYCDASRAAYAIGWKQLQREINGAWGNASG
jgi:hypothetical protein